MGLKEYHRKRDFARTPEPKGTTKVATGRRFVVQKHAARNLHYDFRLEMEGVLKSWAVPKGPSLDPKVKSLAVHVEDHPIDYGTFEGVIPEGEYGGGTVMLWDQGTWEPLGDASKAYRQGKLKFKLHGDKLKGEWTLVRMGGRAGENGRNWLLIKHHDSEVRPIKDYDVLSEDRSASSQRTMDQIAVDADNVWSSNRKASSGKLKRKVALSSNGGPAQKAKTNKVTRKSSPAQGENSHARKGRKKIDPASLTNAKKAKPPTQLTPQLATLVREPPEGDQWVHELKLDGYRIVALLRNGKCRLLTRRDNDWTDNFPQVARAIEQLPVRDAILDGEAVYLETDGKTNFQALQNLMRSGRDDRLVYFAFDLPYCEGYDLRRCPLRERKLLLEQLLGPGALETGQIRYSAHIQDQGDAVFSRACRLGLEGIISKRIDSVYESTRSRHWVKVKCVNRQEFVIGGWSDPSGSRKYFGALLLGYFNDAGQLMYCGRCGTGFNTQSLARMHKELEKRAISKTPFHNPPRGADARDAHWAQPELIAEIEFAEWTSDGMLRQASFEGLREDKAPQEVQLEKAKSTENPSPKARGVRSTKKKSKPPKNETAERSANVVAGVRISNPSRVLFPENSITKIEIARYYETIAEWMLPHLINRPVTLVRCPKGSKQKCFYQKHLTEMLPEPIKGVDVDEKGGTGTYVYIKDLKGLITLVQFGVLEFHPWGSRNDSLEKPDRVIFDLDPDTSLTWRDVISAAFELREFLEKLELVSYLRTSGGKGVHLVVPIQRRAEWPDVKQFAHDVALSMVRKEPNRYIANMSKAKRKGKIFVDYLRNDRGSTAIASYSTRARAGAPVATPILWEELTPKLTPSAFNITNVPERLATIKSDPWEGFLSTQQAVTKKLMKAVASR